MEARLKPPVPGRARAARLRCDCPCNLPEKGQESGARNQEFGVRGQPTAVRSQRSAIRGRKRRKRRGIRTECAAVWDGKRGNGPPPSGGFPPDSRRQPRVFGAAKVP